MSLGKIGAKPFEAVTVMCIFLLPVGAGGE